MHRKLLAALLLVPVFMASLWGCGGIGKTEPIAGKDAQSFTYQYTDEVFYNPLTGFAPQADYIDAVGENTLVYIEVLWKDVEPQEGMYDFSKIEEKNYLERWRKEGKHAVLRFLCDKPSDEEHMDIPQWLYEMTGDGTHYAYDDNHKGYSPDYSNQKLIKAHAKVIEALGKHFQDGFVSYVELGSLGHWGEWHVNYEAGIVRMPGENKRELYVIPYLTAFPNAKILMRRPFRTAEKYGFGLYDDTAGNPEATERWLGWIEKGGDYAQANEKNALSPMSDAWKTAPIGGEFNSDIPLVDMISSQLDVTLSLLEKSHTSFLGPHFPNGLRADTGANHKEGVAAVRKAMGYRLWVKSASYTDSGENCRITLVWKNSGNAPLYFDWEASLYFYDKADRLLGKYPLDMKISELLLEEEEACTVEVKEQLLENVHTVAVGIADPMTGAPAVTLAMDTDIINHTSVLWHTAE